MNFKILNFFKLGNGLVIQFSEISVRPKNPCIFETLIWGGEDVMS